MNSRIQFLFSSLIGSAIWTATAAAQSDVPQSTTAPNAMSAHTWFVIIAIGAFLAWSISYSFQLHKEAVRRRGSREGLLQIKNRLLDQIADLESRKESGEITEQKFKQEFARVKQRLSKVLEQLGGSRDAQVER